jgi:hypothetical protein
MEAHRVRRRARVRNDPPEAVRRWKRTYRLAQYGLTEEDFDRLLEIQEYACAMCQEPFEDGRPISIDHDHACCKAEKRSCGQCVRGLLCLRCNTALGYIERYAGLARAYMADPPAGSGKVILPTGRWRSLGARYLDTVEATGSSPVRPTTKASAT